VDDRTWQGDVCERNGLNINVLHYYVHRCLKVEDGKGVVGVEKKTVLPLTLPDWDRAGIYPSPMSERDLPEGKSAQLPNGTREHQRYKKIPVRIYR
jgi:hypothetical protein